MAGSLHVSLGMAKSVSDYRIPRYSTRLSWSMWSRNESAWCLIFLHIRLTPRLVAAKLHHRRINELEQLAPMAPFFVLIPEVIMESYR